jgi:hypothetical protein
LALASLDAIENTWMSGAGKCRVAIRGIEVSAMSSDLRGRQRTRNWTTYGVTLAIIVVLTIVVLTVGHEAGHLVTNVSQGLDH